MRWARAFATCRSPASGSPARCSPSCRPPGARKALSRWAISQPMPPDHRLHAVVLDEESLSAASRDQEQERQIAIFDLLEENHFVPEGAEGGPYHLTISLIENRLAFDITGPAYQ